MTNIETRSITARTRSGTPIELDLAEVDGLSSSLDGDLILPTSSTYETERLVWNGMIDKRPALIAKCAGSDDVALAVRFARRHDLVMSIRSGGHNAAGAAVCDAGIVIDVGPIKHIDVEPGSCTVRVGGGVTIGELDAATQRHGLAVPQGLVTETGVAGLTLGGGVGWLRRQHGLSCDNLIAAEVVTADGTIVHTSESENPDLLWGLRGGGGSFGVVTSLEFRAHPIGPDVFFAVVVHAGTDMVDALRFYREWAATTPDVISSMAVTWHGPEIPELPEEHHGEPVLFLLAMHSGTPREGEAGLRSLRAHGSPIADLSGVMPYLEVQQFFDEDYPKWEKRYYWTSAYVHELADGLLDELVRLNRNAPSRESTIDVWQLGGAVARIPADGTAFGDRSAAYMLGIEANWEDPAHDAANIEWARSVVRATEPWATGHRYANFPGLYEESDQREFFGGNERRLRVLKTTFDPDHVFDRSHGVTPRTSGN